MADRAVADVGAAAGQAVLEVAERFQVRAPALAPETLGDLAGIFFYPRNGSISVFGLVPLFLLAIILVGILLARKKIPFDSEEKRFMGLSLLISLTVFLAYAFEIHSLNTSSGIVPDIRYLSPLYLPLTIVGLLSLKKVNVFPEKPVDMIKQLLVVGIIGLPFSLILLTLAYAPAAISSTHFPRSTAPPLFIDFTR